MQPIHIIKIISALGFTSLTQQQPSNVHTTMQHALVHPVVFNNYSIHATPVLKLPHD
jgi:hypothetical protein